MEATFRELLDHASVVVRQPGGKILNWTIGCAELFGYRQDEAVGCLSHELLKTRFPENGHAVTAQICNTGEWSGRLRHTAKNCRTVWTLAVCRLRVSSDGAESLIVEQHSDITGYVELEEQRDLLARELEHRVKNLLAVVQSLARISFTEVALEQQDKFHMRLTALAKANQVLWAESWQEADIRELVMEVAQALGAESRLILNGPAARICSSQAGGFALAVHELCTNAVKHGALSVSGGLVDLSWSIDSKGYLFFRWKEQGGPAPESKPSAGFGTRLIRSAIPEASVNLRFEPGGVICEVMLPVGSGS